MTTRLLESFKVLDSYSKRVLEKHAKNNGQPCVSKHCFAYDKGSPVPVLDNDSDFHSLRKSIYKPRFTPEDTKEEQWQLNTRIPKSSTPATSMKGSSSIRSAEVFRAKINIHPFTSNGSYACWTSSSNNKTSAANSLCQDKKEEGMGFIFTPLKKPQSLQPNRQSSPRIKWSKEMEKIPSLHALNKLNRKASVGSSLGYTDTSHWRTSPFNNVDGPFKSSDSDGIYTQELHHGTRSASHKNKTEDDFEKEFTQRQFSTFEEEVISEPVPLSFEDELERKNAKVLTPCPASVYKALPIVSETYPVEYRNQQHQHEPFSSQGFHSLDPPEPLIQDPSVKESKVHSAIIRITESRQTDYMLCSQRERQTGEGFKCSSSYPESESTNLHLLSANGSVVRSSDLDWVPHHKHNDVSLAVPINKSPLIPLVLPRNKVLPCTCIGPVVNGVNPSQSSDPGETSPAYSKLQHDMPKRRLSSRCHTSYPHTQQSTAANLKNTMDFLNISKPVKCRQNGVKGIVPKEQTYEKDWTNDATEMCINIMMSQVSECQTNAMHFFIQTNDVDGKIQDSTNPLKEMNSVTDHTGIQTVSKLGSSINHLQIINIPTAESLN